MNAAMGLIKNKLLTIPPLMVLSLSGVGLGFYTAYGFGYFQNPTGGGVPQLSAVVWLLSMVAGAAWVWFLGEGTARLGRRLLGLDLPQARVHAAWIWAPLCLLALGPVLAPLFARMAGHLSLDVLGKIQWPGHSGFVHLTPAQYLYLLWAGPWITLPWFGLLGIGVWHWVNYNTAEGKARSLSWPILLATGFVFYLGLSVWTTTVYPVTGDEPHYLLMADNFIHGRGLDLTSAMLEKRYQIFYPTQDLDFHAAPSPSGKLVSKHFPLISILLVPGYFLLGRFGAVLFIAFCASAIAVVVTRIAEAWGANPVQCLWVWVLCLATPPLGTYFDLIYTELPASLCLLLGIWAWLQGGSKGLWGAAMAAAFLPWLYPKYIPLSIGLGCLLPFTKEFKFKRVWGPFLLILFSTFGFLHFFQTYYNYGLSGNPFGEMHPFFSRKTLMHSLGIWVDRDFGLVAVSPVIFIGILGIMVQPPNRRLGVAMIGPLMVEYLLYINFIDFTGCSSVFSRHMLPGSLLLFAAFPWGKKAVERAWKIGGLLTWLAVLAGIGMTWICAACPIFRYLAPKEKLWKQLSFVPSLFPSMSSISDWRTLTWAIAWVLILVIFLILTKARNKIHESRSKTLR